MKTAVLENIGDLKIKTLPYPKCRPDEIIIKVAAAGICSTDSKMFFHGHRDLVFPRILGHEVCGRILETGKLVNSQYKKGINVQIAPGITCGKCVYCLNRAQNMCDNMKIFGFHYDGGFAQYMRIPEKAISSGCVNKIPSNLSFEDAVFAEPIACCINALDQMEFTRGENAVIFGAGIIGGLFIQLLKLRGASKIIVVESNRKRLDFAEKFSADNYIHNSNLDDTFTRLTRLTKKGGINNIILACPDKKIISLGLSLLSKRGSIVFFSGLKKNQSKIYLDYNRIHYQEIRITGAYGCTSRQNKTALKLLTQGKIRVTKLISHRLDLENIEQGLNLIKKQKALKVIVNNFGG